MRSHSGERPFVCELCNKQFSLQHHLTNHMATHRTDRPYVCYICDKQFTFAFSLKRHMKTHLDLSTDVGVDILPPPLPARGHLSLDEFSRLSQEFIGIASVQEPAMERQKQQLAVTKVWSCAVCSKRCGSRQTLKRHMLQHDGYVKAHTCLQCGKRFLAAYELNRHRRCHDRQPQMPLCEAASPRPPAAQFRTHTCSECGVEFSTARRVSSHMAICHPGLTHKPYLCTVCSKCFAHPYSLKRHRMQHMDDADVFTCNTCQKQFTTMYDRDRHARTHSSDRPYSCQLCGKRFTQSHHLTNHMTTHSGEKSFICNVCQRQFAQSFALKRHMNVHRRSPAADSSDVRCRDAVIVS